MARIPLFCDFEEWAMDRDVRNAIDEAMIGAAAIGFCLARALAETDPEVAHRLDPIWKDTYAFLRDREEARAAHIVFMFGSAVGNPDLFRSNAHHETSHQNPSRSHLPTREK